MMKILIFISLVLLAGCNSSIQIKTIPSAQMSRSLSSFQWGQNFFAQLGLAGSGTGAEYVDNTITDSQGNIYVSGTTLSNLFETWGGNASGDLYFAKYNNKGERLWVKQIGVESAVPGGDVSQWESCYALFLDDNGYLYCAGGTGGSIGEPNTNARSDMLFIKLNAATGAVVSYKQWGATTGAPSGNATTLNEWFDDMKFYNGKLYFCASSSSDFVEVAGVYDVLAGRMDLDGNFEWINQIGTASAPVGVDVSGRDYGGKILIDGTYLYCGGNTVSSFSEPNAGAAGTYDLLFTKWDMATGALVAYKQYGATTLGGIGVSGAGDEYSCLNLKFDHNGDIICLSSTIGSTNDLDPGNSGDVMVVKLDTDLNPIWVTQLGSNALTPLGGDNSGYEYPTGLSIDSDNNIIVSGVTDGAFAEANGGGSGDAIFAKLDSAGALIDILQYGAVTTRNGASNAGYDECKVLTPIGSRLFCSGTFGGDQFDTQAGDGDFVFYPVEFP
jgi:hypothetical protein